jgi:hypothetical protein
VIRNQHQEVIKMQPDITRYRIDKKTGRQFVIVCLLLLPFILFTLSVFTFVPNTAHTPRTAIGTTLTRSTQMNEMLARNARDVGCSDVIIPEGVSWSGIRMYFNTCALQHLTAFVASIAAGGAFIGLICPECDPLVAWIATIMAGATSGIDFLQYASQGCGGAFLDISWSGGIKLEPACAIQA